MFRATAILCTLLVGASVATAQGRPERSDNAAVRATHWHYPARLALAFSTDARKLRATRVDAAGEVRPSATVGRTVWLRVDHLYQPDERHRQQVVPRLEIRYGKKFIENIEPPVEIPLDLRRNMPALFLHRHVGIERGVSRVAGVIQNERMHLHQAEFRLGTTNAVEHALRVEQWSGPAVTEGGYPVLQITEHLSSVIDASAKEHHNQADTERTVQVFARGGKRLARAVEHHTGKFQWPLDGVQAERTVHVVTEVVRQGSVLSFRVYSSDGREHGESGWDHILASGDTGELFAAPGRSNEGRNVWETPWHPRDPVARHAAAMPWLVMLDLPESWDTGNWDGRQLPPKPIPLGEGGRRWSLGDRDFRWATGFWVFDRNGQLYLRTPLGVVDGKAVVRTFKRRISDAEGDPVELAKIHHEIRVVVAWATFMPQRRGDQRRRAEPALLRLVPRAHRH